MPASKEWVWGGVRVLLVVAASIGLGACAPDDVAEFFRDETPRESYERALAEAGLHQTKVGEAWLDAAVQALNQPVQVASPYREEGFFEAGAPTALGYRITLERGQLAQIALSVDGEDEPRVFLDIFEDRDGSGEEPPRLLEYADSLTSNLRFEPRDGGEFLVRLQPELLVDARYALTIRVDGSLAFPVEGRGMPAVQSVFGDPREGGRRSHHGVDIFAPRNTPVVAVTEGVVSRVQDTRIGGRVVWLRDAERGQSIYYAHLERQLVQRGQRVSPGDTVGLVGNSGNARTTPPHLHFGIYRRGQGPVDPWHHIRRLPQELPPADADPETVGTWVRIGDGGIRLRAAADRRSRVIAELDENLPLRVIASAGRWYRVQRPDGTQGFVAARLTESAEAPLRTVVLERGQPLWKSPSERVPVGELDPDTPVQVHGEFEDYLYVSAPSGKFGWALGLDS